MKRVIFLAKSIFLLAILIPVNSFAYTSPGKATGYVNDFANVMSPETKINLETSLSNLNSSNNIKIAVVTIPSLGDENIETYAVKLFEEWKIGNKGLDNGALLLVSMGDRKVRIEVGYGLESVLTDTQSNYIIQKIIIPEFKNGQYEQGIVAGANAIVGVLKGQINFSESNNTKSNILDTINNILHSFGFIIVVVVFSVLGRTKSWWLGGVMGGIIGIVIGIIYSSIITGIFWTFILTIFGLIVDYFVSKGGGGGHGGMWWGGGHGGSGGGFGGFGGGGRSGGGGASGSW